MSGARGVHSNSGNERRKRLVGVFEMEEPDAAKLMKWICMKRRLQKFMVEG